MTSTAALSFTSSSSSPVTALSLQHASSPMDNLIDLQHYPTTTQSSNAHTSSSNPDRQRTRDNSDITITISSSRSPIIIDYQPAAKLKPSAILRPAVRKGIRPLSMSSSINLPMSPPPVPSASNKLKSDINMTGDVHTSINAGGGNIRLKRLSLLSKSSSVSPIEDSIPVDHPHPSSAPPQTGQTIGTGVFLVDAQLTDVSTPGIAMAGPSTPRSARERGHGMRSSISYSPSVNSPGGMINFQAKRGSMDMRRMESLMEGWEKSGENSFAEEPATKSRSLDERKKEVREKGHVLSEKAEDTDIKRSRTVLTVTEKHSDLLTAIAQKERRVNELRQELAQQEASLAALKSKWTAIASRSHSRPFTSQRPSSQRTDSKGSKSQSKTFTSSPVFTSPISHSREFSTSTSSQSTSSITSDPSIASLDSSHHSASGEVNSEERELVLRNRQLFDEMSAQTANSLISSLVSTAYGPAGVLTPSAVEGGKRFLGQLVKTVSAAAAGNVPGGEDEESGDSTGMGLDLMSLKGMVALPSWASMGPQQSVSTDNRQTICQPAKQARQPSNIDRLPRIRKTSGISVPRSTSPARSIRPAAKNNESLIDLDADSSTAPSSSITGKSGSDGDHDPMRRDDRPPVNSTTPGHLTEESTQSDDEWGW